MAEPTDPQELAKVQAQDLYNAAAIGIEDLLDDFPNPTWDSTRMDTWLIDTVSHLSMCEQYWSQVGITSKAWYKLEYSLIMRVPDLSMDLVAFGCTEFNELVEQVLAHDLDIVPLPVRCVLAKRTKAMASPSQFCQEAAAPGSQLTTPALLPMPSKTSTPVLLLVTAKPSTSNSGASNEQVVQPPADQVAGAQQHTAQRKVKPTPITTGSGNIAFPPDPSSPLHRKLGTAFKVGPPIHDARSTTSVQSLSSRLLTVDAATGSSVAPGPNPAQEGSVTQLPNVCGPLFFPGTDDEEEPVQEDSVREDPLPTKKARRLRQEPRISFVFNDTTGDFVNSYPTIFLPRLAAPSFRSQDLRCSAQSNTSPVNRDAAYLKTAHGSKPDVKKKKKQDLKRKDNAPEVAIPHKCAQEDDNVAPAVQKPAIKKLKSKDIKTANDKVELNFWRFFVCATPAICKRGSGPSKPLAVTLGIGGGGFGEKVPSITKAIKNGLKSIGVLEVEEDFGNFMKVDGHYWNKEVAPFVGERYTKPYTLNAFEGALDTLAQHADSIEDIVVNYMAGLNVLTQLNGLQI
ncbi:hypothetical protein EDD85DRAFT_946177 [Armillaria nabsnona]|nr:hypothetical protein EDD85DRAFT_946177 [Armillaria nabsnona]